MPGSVHAPSPCFIHAQHQDAPGYPLERRQIAGREQHCDACRGEVSDAAEALVTLGQLRLAGIRRRDVACVFDHGLTGGDEPAEGEPLSLDASLSEALSAMTARRADRLPVCDDEGRHLGIIALADLVR